MSLGVALGVGSALLGGMGGSSGSQSSTSSVPSWMMPFLTGGDGVLTGAQELYQEGTPDYYGGDMVADLTPEQLQALDMVQGNVASSYLPDAATDLTGRTIAGEFLGGDQFMEAYGDDILDAVTSRFGRAGRSGSALEADAAVKELGNVASRLYGSERDRMQSAAAMSPSIEASRYAPAQQMLNVGNILQQQEQSEIGADVAEWEYETQAPWQQLENYANLVYGAPAGSTTTTDLNRNPWSGLLGGGLAGFGTAGQLGLFN